MLLNYLFPNYCYGCQTSLDSPGLCVKCWTEIKIHSVSFQLSQCQGTSAVFYHQPLIKKLMLQFKHGDKPQLSSFLAFLIEQSRILSSKKIDRIVPIPLHWTRLFCRQYNQAGLIAQVLSKRTGIPCQRLLKRSRMTPPQGKGGTQDRHQNVSNAFQVCDPSQLKDKSILLVDDVITSGATLDEIARVLQDQGVRSVEFATVAYARADLD